MYCQECGAQNDNGAKFCEECGALLEQQTDQQTDQQHRIPAASQKKEVKRKKNPVMVIEAVALIVLSLLCCYQVKRINNPENLVKRYMDAVFEQDWEEAYSYLDLPEEDTEYLSASSYAVSRLSKEFADVTNYAIETDKYRKENSDIVRSYIVNYRKRGNASELSMYVPVTKGRNRRFLVLDDWKISADGDLILDTTINLPPYATVSLDGHVLDSPEEDGKVTIPYLFKGDHVVEVTMEGTEPYSQVVTLNNSGSNLKLKPPYLREETVRGIAGKSIQYWEQLLDYIVNPTSEQPEFLSDAADMQREKARYEIGGYDSYFTSMDLRDITAEVISYGHNPEGEGLKLVIDLKGTLNRKTQYGKQNWFSNQITYEPRESDKTARLRLQYYFDGSEWNMKHLSTES